MMRPWHRYLPLRSKLLLLAAVGVVPGLIFLHDVMNALTSKGQVKG
jgi:hypothetical protein